MTAPARCECGRLADKVPSKSRFKRRAHRRKKRQRSAISIADEPVCNRCLHLDGASTTRYVIIAVLRDFGRLQVKEIAAITGLAESNVQHHIRRLIDRIERIEDDTIEGNLSGMQGFAYRLTKDI